MSAHTPGPWHFLGDALTHRMFNIYTPNGTDGREEHVATVNNLPVETLWRRDADRALANARLVAAAPDMLEALASISLSGNDNTAPAHVVLEGVVRRARAAIAKARGTR